MSRNLIARLAVAAVAIPVILWIVYQGGWWLFGMLLLFALIGMGEFLAGENYRTTSPAYWLVMVVLTAIYGTITGLPIAPLSALVTFIGGSVVTTVLTLLVGFFLISAMLFAIGKQPPPKLMERHSRLFWGLTYLSLTYPIVFLVGNGVGAFHGGDSLLYLFGLLWVGDTAAMGVGSAMGRHKLAPTVSPNKTVEGFIGGIVGALAIGVLMYFWKFHALGFGHVMAIAIGCSIFGQLGDLVESMWKRSLGIKDSSAIIPGHGGVLDRFDSLLFAAPFMYAYLMFLTP